MPEWCSACRTRLDPGQEAGERCPRCSGTVTTDSDGAVWVKLTREQRMEAIGGLTVMALDYRRCGMPERADVVVGALDALNNAVEVVG